MLTRGALRGLHFPPVTHYRDTGPAVPGATWRGANANSRRVHWTLQVFHDEGTDEWLELERAFWRIMDPQHTLLWEVRTGSAQSARTLRVRHEPDDSYGYDMDAPHFGWASYPVDLMADQPFWSGPVIQRRWGGSGQANFFGGGVDTKAPLFYISSGSQASAARINNPGDVPAYPVWILVGPLASGWVGVAGKRVTVPFAIPEGKALVLDSDPRRQTAAEATVVFDAEGSVAGYTPTGVFKTHLLSTAEWVSIAPGASVKLDLDVVGAGSVHAQLTPLYYKAW
jgi:hypothetical protein